MIKRDPRSRRRVDDCLLPVAGLLLPVVVMVSTLSVEFSNESSGYLNLDYVSATPR